MEADRRKRPRTALVCLRMPWLYAERGQISPGRTGLADRGQVKAMIAAVKKARRERRIEELQAAVELGELRKGLDIIAKGPHHDVGVYFPLEDCWPAPPTRRAKERKRSKAARKARKAQRRSRR